ncbi:MAG: secretin and TonB N-terminal domain-containing protein [Planctomycetes bacterium]|nr:secretin and TonB N-terminal domain-containing protein [Planctomycetota bacterium]
MLQKAERTQFTTSTKRQAPAATTAAGIVALVVVCVVNAHGQSPTAVKPRQPSYNIQRTTSDGSQRVGRKPKTQKETDSVFEKVRSTFGVWRALPKSSKDESKSVKGTRIRPTEKKPHSFWGRLRRRKPASSKNVADDSVGTASLDPFTDRKNARHTRTLTNSSQRPALQPAPPPDRLPPAAIGARPIGPTGTIELTEEQFFDTNDGLRIRRTVDSRQLSQAWETFDRDFSKHKPDHSNLNHRSHPGDNSSYFHSPQLGRESGILQVSRMQTENPVVDFLQSLTNPQKTPTPGGPKFKVPIAGAENPGTVEIASNKGRISLIVRDAPIDHVLGLIAQQHGLNIVTSKAVTGQISVTLSDVPLDDALDAILRVNGYTWVRQKNILLITQITGESKVSPVLQGRQLRVFSLNYLSATDVDKVVQGLLSPIGQSFAIESDPLDKLRTREQIVVEDLPEYLRRVEAYISQIDLPPRQVLIEAHILSGFER